MRGLLLLIVSLCGCVVDITASEPFDEEALRATMAARDVHHAAGPLVFGEVTVDHQWKRVTFARPIKDPVVVARPFSSNGYQPGVLRMRNLDSTGFELRIQEWSYLDDWHFAERVGYVAAERGAHTLQSGNLAVVAGSFQTDKTEFARVSFSHPLPEKPVVLTSVATFSGSDAVTGRLELIDAAGFDYKLQEEEAQELHHKTEQVNYLALAPGAAALGGFRLVVSHAAAIDHQFRKVHFAFGEGGRLAMPVFVAETQTTNGNDTVNLRWRNKTTSAVELQLSEEQSLDAETSHVAETVGYVAIGGPAGGPADFHVVAPLYAQLGKPFTLKVARIDRAREYLRDTTYRATVALSSTDKQAKLPATFSFNAADGGYRELQVTFNTLGLHHLSVTEQATGKRQRSNIIKVLDAPPARQIFFGDIHSHTPISDGRTHDVDQNYRYARDVALLDIAAVTDHDTLEFCCATTASEWSHLTQRAAAYHAPGRFVTIPAYEWTDGNRNEVGSGHKNVYFVRQAGAEIYSHADPAYDGADNLWRGLETRWSPGEALTIPHHPARIYKGHDRSSTDWSQHDPRFQRLVEIYSSHGLFERCAVDAFQPPEGKAPARCVRYALSSHGYRLGFVAAGDHHLHPLGYLGPSDGADSFGGLHFSGGLTAVMATALSREALFSAMYNRSTYATSGERILLEVDVDGRPMGSQYEVALPHAPVVTVTVGGTQPIDEIEISKFDQSSRWTVAHTRHPDALTASFSFTDKNFTGSSIYYVRVRQRSGALHSEEEMAWSSPVWVDVK